MTRTQEPAHMRTPAERRRRRRWFAGGAVAAAVTGAGIVWALLALRAEFTGGGNIAAPPGVEISNAAVVAGATADCTVSTPGGDLALQIDGGTGESCDVTMKLTNVGDFGGVQVKIQGVDFSASTSEAFVQTFGQAACWAPLDDPLGKSTRVRFTLTGTPGSFTASPTAGIRVSDAPNDPTCTNTPV